MDLKRNESFNGESCAEMQEDNSIFQKNTSRAYRRERKNAMKAKARRIYGAGSEKLADNLALCSNPWCCGNARRAHGPTVKELQWDEILSDSLKDLYS
jgi:hypothetical protein